MTSATLQRPDDVEVLRGQLAERDAQLAERDARIAQLEHENACLRRAHFGPRSERRRGPDDPSQGRFLFPELLEQAQRVADATGATGTIELTRVGHPSRQRTGRRTTFPDHLPVVRTTYELPEDQRTCCGRPMAAMGHETSRRLERLEVSLVHEIARTKYACRVCQETVRMASGPERVIDKGLLGTSFLAHVITERFARHMPYYRLEQKYKSEGLSLSRSVLCRSALRCAELLLPIVEQVKRELLSGFLVGTDDTPITIQKHGPGRTTGHSWTYRDTEGRIVYDFTASRSRDGPVAFFGDYAGYVQADAYSGYDVLFTDSRRIEVGCMAHARRYFVEAQPTSPELAGAALERIARLYAIERQAKQAGLGAAAITALRQEQAVPVLTELRAWLESIRPTLLPKEPMATAVGYALAQWRALGRYTEDGRIPIDNNGAERALRPLAVGRKNWLFVGHEEAGQQGAVLFSLVATCREIGIDPRLYLQDVLERIATCSDVGRLTPHGWKEHFLPQVAARRDALLANLAALAR